MVANDLDEIEVLKIFYKQTMEWSQKLAETLTQDDLELSHIMKFEVPGMRTEMRIENFSPTSQMLIQLGSENAGVAMNGGVLIAGIYTGSHSAANYNQSHNPVARKFYLLSMAFSLSAIGNCGIAVASRACKLSSPGVLSEALGAGFMWCGNLTQAAALRAEGRAIPPYLSSAIRKPNLPNGNLYNKLAFVGSHSAYYCRNLINSIPLHKIGKVVMISITIYTYSKLLIASYRYGQQLVCKFTNTAPATVKFRTGVQGLIFLLYESPSVRTRFKIYKFAIS